MITNPYAFGNAPASAIAPATLTLTPASGTAKVHGAAWAFVAFDVDGTDTGPDLKWRITATVAGTSNTGNIISSASVTMGDFGGGTFHWSGLVSLPLTDYDLKVVMSSTTTNVVEWFINIVPFNVGVLG